MTPINEMTTSDIKLELMKLNDSSFVFNQRDELVCALKAARNLESNKMLAGLNDTSTTTAVSNTAVDVDDYTNDDDGVEMQPSTTGTTIIKQGALDISESSDRVVPDMASVSSSGESTTRSSSMHSSSVSPKPSYVRRGSRDKDTSNKKPPTFPTDDASADKSNQKSPSSKKKDISTTEDDEDDQSSSNISRRLVEYFVMVSSIPITNNNTDTKTTKSTRRRPPNPDTDNMNSRTKSRFDARRVHLQQQQVEDTTTTNNEDTSILLEPQITARYPPTDYPNQPLNLRLPQFCHPEGTELIHPTTQYKMPRVHHFVLTDSLGGKLYGTALTVYEEFHHDTDKGGEKKKSAVYYAPRVLTLLSTYPYLTAFRTYLTQLYRLATTTNCMTIPIERYVQNICMEVPAPPPGVFEVELCIHPSLGSSSMINFWSPPADQPIAYVSLPYQVLFECLDIGNILFAWYTLACERKVLLVSSQLSLLTVCSEILCSLLFPMKWSHLYIPVLPRSLTPMLDAPMPYLCGISRENFGYAVEDISDETVVVDLDRNVITLGSDTQELPPLPHNRRKKLEATLKENVGDVFWQARNLSKAEVLKVRASGNDEALSSLLDDAGQVWEEKVQARDDAFNLAYAPDSVSMQIDEGANDDIANGTIPKQSKWDKVQEAFLRFYVSVLQDYRKFLPEDNGSMEERSTWRGKDGLSTLRFKKEEFVAAAPSEFQPFLEELSISQQFDDFVTRKMHNAGDAPDIKFFDQSIDAKKNRSKLKLKKKETPFLHSACAHRELKRIKAVEPSCEDLPPKEDGESAYAYNMWPLSFDDKHFGTPRPIPSIISAEFDRRSALRSMLRSQYGVVGDTRGLGGFNRSPEVTSFVLFFTTFTSIIGRELSSVEKKHGADAVDRQMKKQGSARQSLTDHDDDTEVARTIAKAQIDLGFHVLSLMRERKLTPEPIAYKLLIQACGRCGITHRAASIMNMLARDGLATNSEIYTNLISAFSNDESQPSSLALYQIRDDNMSGLSISDRDGDGSSTSGLLRSSTSSEHGESSRRLLDKSNRSSTPSEHSLDLISEYSPSEVSASGTKKKSRFSMKKPSGIKGKHRVKSPGKMTKKMNRRVTAAISKQIDLGESLLDTLYPGISIDTDNICPKCAKTLKEDDIYSGWKPCASNEYEMKCSCSHKFVPKFLISSTSPDFEGSQGKGTPLYCDHLSPWVVLREIRSVLHATGGIDSILDEKFRSGANISSTLWWNMIVLFRRYKLPFIYLLQGSFHNNLILPPPEEESGV